MPITKRGVYHNLKESKYVVSNEDITFFFSSEYTLNKFMDRYKMGREIFNKQLSKISDVPLNYDMIADIETYKLVEKRGFYVWLKGISISLEELSQYALRMMAEKKSPEWIRTDRPRIGERFK